MKVISYFLFISLLFIGSISGQSADELLKNIQQKFDSVEDFSTDFNSVYGIAGAENQKLNGKFFYKKKDKIRLELKNNIIVSDSESTWNYNIKTKKVVVNYTSEYPNTLSLNSYIFEYPTKCRLEKRIEDNRNVLRLISEDEELNFETADLFFTEDYLISKIRVTDFQGMSYTASLKNLKINNGLKDSKFVFTAPEGVRIIDLR